MSDSKRLLSYYQTLKTQRSNPLTLTSSQFQVSPPCNDKNAVWGSEKPVQEICSPQKTYIRKGFLV